MGGGLKGARMELPWDEYELAILSERVGGLRGGIAWTRWAIGRLARLCEMEAIGVVLEA